MLSGDLMLCRSLIKVIEKVVKVTNVIFFSDINLCYSWVTASSKVKKGCGLVHQTRYGTRNMIIYPRVKSAAMVDSTMVLTHIKYATRVCSVASLLICNATSLLDGMASHRAA